MIKGRCFPLFGVLALLISESIYGLGLGELELNSTLNQRLDAKIELTNTGNLGEAEILPSLASQEDFQRVGVERIYALNDLKFNVTVGEDGKPVIFVTTGRPVVEPYLNFLVEVLWPTGRILREYTILLDPPTYDVEGVQPLRRVETPGISPIYSDRQRRNQIEDEQQDSRRFRLDPSYRDRVFEAESRGDQQQQEIAGQGETAPGTPRSRRSQRQTRQPPEAGALPRRTIREQQIIGNEYGMTVRGDTLWNIATRIGGSDSLSIQQVMLALQRANPQAFISDNINLLKAGYLLRIPGTGEMQEMSFNAAVAEVQIQNDAFEAYKSGGVAVRRDSVRQLDGTGGSATQAGGETAADEGELKILAGGSQAGSQSGSGDTASNGSNSQLGNELSLAMEDLDRVRRENSELKLKMDDLTGQLDTLNQMIKVRDDQLAAFRALLDQSQEDPGGTTSSETPPEIAQQQPPDQGGQTQANQQNNQTSVQETPGKAPQTAKPDNLLNTLLAKVEPVLVMLKPVMDKLKSDPLMLGGAVLAVVLVLAVIMFSMRRRRQAVSLADDNFAVVADDEPELADLAEDGVGGGLADDVVESLLDDDLGLDEDLLEDGGDPIFHADNYMGFERYPQAISLLQNAIEAEPERSDLQLKLMEVYVQTDDAAEFNNQFEQLKQLGDEQAINFAAQMQQQFAGAGGAEEASLDDLDDLDISADGDADLGDLDELGDLDDLGDFGETAADDDLSLDLDSGDDDLSLDLDSGDDDLSLDLDSGDDDLSLDLDSGDDDLSLDLDSGDDDLSLDLDSGNDDLSLDLDSGDDDLSLDLDSGDDDLSLDLDSGDDDLSLDLDSGDDDLNLDLDSGDETFDLGDEGLDLGDEGLDLGDEELDLGDDTFSLEGDLDLDDVDLDLDGFDLDDETDNKLDLARAYIDMGDKDGARDVLQQVVQNGSSEDVQEANQLLAQID